MPDAATLLSFTGISLLLALAPGPDILFVLTQSALQGARAGLAVTLGLCTGLIFHTTAVALGLAILFQASALAFTLLKCLGAAYLLYLAWGALRAGTEAGLGAGEERISLWRFYRRGIVMNVTNPKVSLFFLAFLPQFTNPAQGRLTVQLILLGGLFMASALVVFSGVSLCAGMIAAWFRRSARIQRGLNVCAGLIFIGLAVKLLAF